MNWLDENTDEFHLLSKAMKRGFNEKQFCVVGKRSPRCNKYFTKSLNDNGKVPIPGISQCRLVAIGVETRSVEIPIVSTNEHKATIKKFNTPKSPACGEIYDTDVYYIREARLKLKDARSFGLEIERYNVEAFDVRLPFNDLKFRRYCKKNGIRTGSSLELDMRLELNTDGTTNVTIKTHGWRGLFERLPLPKAFYRKRPVLVITVAKVFANLQSYHNLPQDDLEHIDSTITLKTRPNPEQKKGMYFNRLRRRRKH